MRRVSLALSATLALFGASACGGDADAPEAPETTEVASTPEVEATETAPGAVPDAAVETAGLNPDAAPAAPGAPGFAVIYPGGVVQGDDDEPASGSGGIVTYVTTASPDEVIAFHRARAEAEGLASVMAMNQGDARAYGAHSTHDGANLSIFATPIENGATVQLGWSAGG